MKISIITTCYNRKHSIASAIESVKTQDYHNIEYVVIDGASRDGSVDIIKSYKKQIDILISEPDGGIYQALNKGIKYCKGDIVGLLHSDDLFYDTNTLSRIAQLFQESDADIVYAKGQYIDRKNMTKVNRIYPSKGFKTWFIYFGWIPLHTTIFVRRTVFEQYGLYREDFKIASDYEISLRWFTNPRLKKVYLDMWTVRMLLGGKSTDMRQQQQKSAEDLKIIREYKLWGYFTLFCKIARKIPQYVIPKIKHY